MKKLLPLLFLSIGIMFFFLGTGFFKLKDPNWTDKGAGGMSYVISVLAIIIGITGLVNSDKG